MVGRKIGKHKLWPVISPNKTWEGSIGAVICAVIVAAVYVDVYKRQESDLCDGHADVH